MAHEYVGHSKRWQTHISEPVHTFLAIIVPDAVKEVAHHIGDLVGKKAAKSAAAWRQFEESPSFETWSTKHAVRHGASKAIDIMSTGYDCVKAGVRIGLTGFRLGVSPDVAQDVVSAGDAGLMLVGGVQAVKWVTSTGKTAANITRGFAATDDAVFAIRKAQVANSNYLQAVNRNAIPLPEPASLRATGTHGLPGITQAPTLEKLAASFRASDASSAATHMPFMASGHGSSSGSVQMAEGILETSHLAAKPTSNPLMRKAFEAEDVDLIRHKPLDFDYSSHGACYSLRIDPATGTGPMHVDMTGMKPVHIQKNKYGFPKNGPEFWKTFEQKYPGILSEENVSAIMKRKAPAVDKQWLEHFPEHEEFLGQTLDHHHLDHGALAYPLPTNLHRGKGNIKVWHEFGDKQ